MDTTRNTPASVNVASADARPVAGLRPEYVALLTPDFSSLSVDQKAQFRSMLRLAAWAAAILEMRQRVAEDFPTLVNLRIQEGWEENSWQLFAAYDDNEAALDDDRLSSALDPIISEYGWQLIEFGERYDYNDEGTLWDVSVEALDELCAGEKSFLDAIVGSFRASE